MLTEVVPSSINLGVIAEVISAYALVTKSQNLLMAFSKKVDFYTDPDCKDNTSTNAPVNKAYSPYCPETDFRLP